MAIKLNYKYEPLFDQNNNCRYFIITGGRASSKSFSVANALINYSFEFEHVILFCRYTMVSAETSIIPEFTEKINLLGYDENTFSKVKDEITNLKTNSKILFKGIQTSSGNQTAKLKGTQGLTIFVLDEAEELEKEEDFDIIDQSIRTKGKKNKIIIIMNPADDKHWIYKRFFKDANISPDFNGIIDNICYINTDYEDNLENLSESYLKIIADLKVKNYKKYLHYFKGQWNTEKEGALWKQSLMIDPFRVIASPELKRIIVAIDPSVSSSGNQDECGIIVAGQGFDDHYYILEDASDLFIPSEWGRVAVGKYKKYQCDNIIAESNQGGDLVKMNIQNTDKSVPVKMVRATRGKLLRAEPIQSLYEQGKVHHVGEFYNLELEMTTYIGDGDSPNRLDAMVWALTELSQNDFTLKITQL